MRLTATVLVLVALVIGRKRVQVLAAMVGPAPVVPTTKEQVKVMLVGFRRMVGQKLALVSAEMVKPAQQVQTTASQATVVLTGKRKQRVIYLHPVCQTFLLKY